MQLPLRFRTRLYSWFRWTDAGRWRGTKELSPAWDDRTRLIAGLVPADARVIEFGAGRRQLQQYLRPGCLYVPSDLVDRGADTLVCDLNRRPLPDLSRRGVNTAVFGGVLEYVYDPQSVVTWLSGYVQCCIVSYECADTRSSDPQRSRESKVRARIGWVNTFHEDEFVALFQSAGFALTHREVWRAPDGDEPVFVFNSVFNSLNSPRPNPSPIQPRTGDI
jgi:hypothetical protein